MFQHAATMGIAAATGRALARHAAVPTQAQVHGQAVATALESVFELPRFRAAPVAPPTSSVVEERERVMGHDPGVVAASAVVARGGGARRSATLDVRGYFQSDAYFRDVEPDVRAEFRLLDPVAQQAGRALDEARRRHARDRVVGLHVRRGDEVGLRPWATAGPPDPDGWLARYLAMALDEIDASSDDTVVVVFAGGNRDAADDRADVGWCARELPPLFPDVAFDFGVSGDMATDFAAMTLCDALALNSPSSFGWWAGYLGATDRTVVVPVGASAPDAGFEYDWASYYPSGFVKACVGADPCDVVTFPSIVGYRRDGHDVPLYLNVRLVGDRVHAVSFRDPTDPSPTEQLTSDDGRAATIEPLEVSEHPSYANVSLLVIDLDAVASPGASHAPAAAGQQGGRGRHAPIRAGNHVLSVPRTPVPDVRGGIAVMTLFKDDGDLIPGFVDHYARRLGVDRFFMYHNGPVLPDDLHRSPAVTYVRWPHPWNVGPPGAHAHCAQIGAINDFLAWAGRSFEAVAFVDLDEYLVFAHDRPTDWTADLRLGKHAWLGFRNRFAALRPGRNGVSSSLVGVDVEALTEPSPKLCEFGFRSKCVVDPAAVTQMGIHVVLKTHDGRGGRIADGAEILHVTNFPGRVRLSGTTEDAVVAVRRSGRFGPGVDRCMKR